MRRFGAQIQYFLRSALLGLRTSAVTAAVAVTTIGVTLLLVGAFAMLVANMERILDRFGDELSLSAYLEDPLSAGAQAALERRVRAMPGVKSVVLVSKEEALERFRTGVGRGAAYLEGLEDNPLPASLEIGLEPEYRSPKRLPGLIDSLESMQGIEELGYGREWTEGYARAVAVVRAVGVAIGVVLALAALLIIANTIRLGVYARSDELEILMLVGASRSFTSIPFLLEGLAQGILGGALALGLLYLFFRLTVSSLGDGLAFAFGHTPPEFLSGGACLLLVAGGGALGIAGSLLALLQGQRS